MNHVYLILPDFMRNMTGDELSDEWNWLQIKNASPLT